MSLISLVSLAEEAVRYAERNGAHEAEVYVLSSQVSELGFEDNIDFARSAELSGMGVKTIIGKRIGYHSVSSTTALEVETAVKNSLAIAKATPPDSDWVSLNGSYGSSNVEGTFDKQTERLQVTDLAQQAGLVIEKVRDTDTRLSVARGHMAVGKNAVVIANSQGCCLKRDETYSSFWIDVKAEDGGKVAASNEAFQSRSWKKIDFEALTKAAASRALRMLDAKRIPSGHMDVLWRNDVFAALLGIMLARNIAADNVQQKRSPLAGKLGQPVSSEAINIVDDGLRPGGIGTRSFDDEGTTQDTFPIVERGILRSYLYDCYTANKEGRSSTGNAHRSGGGATSLGSYMRPPMPAPNNLILQPTGVPVEEMIRETRDGLYVIETIGEWLSNPVSGDLTATVTSAYTIGDGEIKQPVKGVIVTGNFSKILNEGLDLIGNDLANSQNVYSPSVRSLKMAVAGQDAT